MSDSAKLLMGVLAILTAFMGFYTFTQKGSPVAAPPQVIYMQPAPAGALLPTTPPQQAPR